MGLCLGLSPISIISVEDAPISQGPTKQQESSQGYWLAVLGAAMQSAVFATGLIGHSFTPLLVDTRSAVTLVHPGCLI